MAWHTSAHAFAGEQLALSLDTPAVPRKAAIGPNDPMTGDGHRYRIGSARLRDGAGTGRCTDATGHPLRSWRSCPAGYL